MLFSVAFLGLREGLKTSQVRPKTLQDDSKTPQTPPGTPQIEAKMLPKIMFKIEAQIASFFIQNLKFFGYVFEYFFDSVVSIFPFLSI